MKTSEGLGVGRTAALAGATLVSVAIVLTVLSAPWRINSDRQQAHDHRTAQNASRKTEQKGFDLSGWEPATAIDRYTLLLTAFTGVLAIVSIGQGYFLLRADRNARDAIELANREFVSAHPPRIIVRRVSLDEGSGSAAGGISRPWKIEYIIANTGLGKATVFEGNATVAVLENGLPAKPPFDDGIDLPYPITLETGQSTPESVYLEDAILAAVRNKIATASWDKPASEVLGKPVSATPNCIYFLGYLLYRDDIGTVRRTAFCRLYDFRTKRFTIVQDPDYEYN